MAKARLQRQEVPTVSSMREMPPERAKEQGYITKWLMLGPIRGAGDAAALLDTDFLGTLGGEANMRASEGDKFEYEGGTLTWQVIEILPSRNSIGQLEGFDVDNAVAYLVHPQFKLRMNQKFRRGKRPV